MDGSKMLQKIDLLLEQGNMVWESPGSNASRDIALFCDAVKDLVQAIYGSGHPYIEKHAAASKDLQHDLGEGMSVLKSIRKQVEYSSHLGH